MLHHKESQEKTQYNMANSILPSPPPPTAPFLVIIFRISPFPSILKKSNPTPLYEGGGLELLKNMLRVINMQIFIFFFLSIKLVFLQYSTFP